MRAPPPSPADPSLARRAMHFYKERSMKREEHAARINAAWQQGVAAVIETGLRIIDAREGLEHGEFEKMVRNDLHISPGTARKLLAVASNKVIANRSHVNDLPASWGTLYELTSAENKGLDLEAGIKSGAIHPKMERKDVKALLPPPQRDDDLEEPDKEDDQPGEAPRPDESEPAVNLLSWRGLSPAPRQGATSCARAGARSCKPGIRSGSPTAMARTMGRNPLRQMPRHRIAGSKATAYDNTTRRPAR